MEALKPFRERINVLDDQIVDLLVERFDIVRDVADLKARENIAVVQSDRVKEVVTRNVDRAKAKGLDADLVRDLYVRIIDYAHVLEGVIARQKAEEDVFGT